MVAFTEYYLCFEGKRTKKLWMHLKRKNKKINMATATKTYSLLSKINLEVANVYLHCVLQYYNLLNTAFCSILTILCYKAMFCCRFKSKTMWESSSRKCCQSKDKSDIILEKIILFWYIFSAHQKFCVTVTVTVTSAICQPVIIWIKLDIFNLL